MLRSGDEPGAPPSVPPEPSRVTARRATPRPFLGAARELSTNLGLLLASVTVALLAAEAGTRLFSRIGPSLLVTDPVVGKHYVPGFQGRVFVDEV